MTHIKNASKWILEVFNKLVKTFDLISYAECISESHGSSHMRSHIVVRDERRVAFGFTLAEVLIALAIIGVVAAMTTTIIKKTYEKVYYAAAVKKHESIMLSAINSVMQDNGGAWFGCSQALPGFTQECSKMWDALSLKLRVVDECTHCLPKYKGRIDLGLTPGGDGTGWQTFLDTSASPYKVKKLNDGSLIFNYTYDFNWPFYAFDVNGVRPPNKWGYDVYYVMLGGNNFIYSAKPFKPIISNGQGFGNMVEAGGKNFDERIKD